MKCSNCGKIVSSRSSFCSNCGKQLNKTDIIKEIYFNPDGVTTSASELKKRAREKLKGNFILVGAVVITMTFLLGVPVIGFVLGGVFSVGLASYLIQIVKDKKTPELDTLIVGFEEIERNIVFGILKFIFLLLWHLLFIIPGIIKKYSYAMSDFIAYENPQLSAQEVIQKSEEMMKGNKGKLFLLNLSFIGWRILSIFTLGIGFFFLRPYVKMAYAEFYYELTFTKETVIDEYYRDFE